MEPFRRIWCMIKSWLLIGIERDEDNGADVSQMFATLRPLSEELAAAKAEAVTIVGRRNEVRNRLRCQQKRAARLEAAARAALRRGDFSRGQRLLDEEMSQARIAISSLTAELGEAQETAARVKQTIFDLEEQVRERMREQLDRIAWRAAARFRNPLPQLTPLLPSAEPRLRWIDWTGWAMFLFLLVVLGWRVWTGS